MEPSDLLRHLVEALERLGVPYFITGSISAIAHGEPRFTNDIDVVVDLGEEKVVGLCGEFPFPEYYVSEDAAREAVRERRPFNIIHPASGLKIDVIVGRGDAFDRSRFARTLRMRPEPDYEAAFDSPEDLILKKLEFHREGGSEKHLRDIAGILKVSGERIDRTYIAGWAKKLGLEEEWAAALERSAGR